MKDTTLTEALRSVGKRPYSPGTWYEGDRPCIPWTPFLMCLFPEDIVDGMPVKLHFTRPKFRRSTYTNK